MNPINGKVRLFKVEPDGEEWQRNSGIMTPNPPQPGKSLCVGSISSGTLTYTSEVQSVKQIPGGIELQTLNSIYRVRPIE